MTVLLITPFLVVNGVDVLWSGPVVPVLGQLDVTTEELAGAAIQAVRLAAVTLAFAVYALLLDHDALLRSARFARRSALVVALATRLVPTLERDVRGLVEALRGRGVEVTGVRGRARLVSPIVAGSLERALNLAEAMEARGYGRAGATQAPSPRWRSLDRLALVGRSCSWRERAAVATARGLSFSYGDGGADGPALADVSLDVAPGEIVLLAGRSGCGKTTDPRSCRPRAALPRGPLRRQRRDRRLRHATRPAELAGKVATLFQDPEDQVVFDGVLAEVSFGIENSGAPSGEIERRARAALEDVGAAHLAERRVAELSGRRAATRLPRVDAGAGAGSCSCWTADVPTRCRGRRRPARAWYDASHAPPTTAVVISEHRVARTSAYCDRVISLEHGAIVSAGQAVPTLEQGLTPWQTSLTPVVGELVCRLDRVDLVRGRRARALGHHAGPPPRRDRRADGRQRERGSRRSASSPPDCSIPIAARGRLGRAAYLSQDPGRYLARDRCDDEVALGARDPGRPQRGRSARWASPATKHGIHETCRAASGSAWHWQRCWRASPTCSCSTSRPAASTPKHERGWPRCCAVRHRSARRYSSPTITSSPQL